jgi:hypothetical protein
MAWSRRGVLGAVSMFAAFGWRLESSAALAAAPPADNQAPGFHADRIIVQGFHYPFPASAYVEKLGSGCREIPRPWMPVL